MQSQASIAKRSMTMIAPDVGRSRAEPPSAVIAPKMQRSRHTVLSANCAKGLPRQNVTRSNFETAILSAIRRSGFRADYDAVGIASNYIDVERA